MGPSKNVINGSRPSPLSISKCSSQFIRKQPFVKEHNRANPCHNPVIIYVHSPKVIHTKPRDFMALVQRLTGFSRLEENEKNKKNIKETIDLNKINPGRSNDEDEICLPSRSNEEVTNSSHLDSPSFPNQLLVDMPLFTPGSNNLFFSPFPNMASPTWPSILASKKDVQQY